MTSPSEALRSVVRGHVVLPGDDAFETARQPWNLAVDQPVAAVVEAADADDVVALVRHAAATGATIATQAGGHGATGDLKDAILLRTTRLDELSVDPDTRLARVGAGVAWGEVQKAASAYGLSGLPGSSPIVSVMGYTLGGGLSWFGRAFGWAADSVTAYDVVTADGETARVTAADDPDLFWALSGGGGDFAVVTAVEFRLHPVPALFGGRVLWPGERAASVLSAYAEVAAAAPETLTVWLDLLHFPGAEPMVAVDVTYLGPAAEAEALLRPIDAVGGTLRDGRGMLPVADLGTITAEPTDPGPSVSRSALLTRFDSGVAKALLDNPIAPMIGVQVRQLGGVLAGPSGTPFGPLTEPWYVYAVGLPIPDAAPVSLRQDELIAALGDAVSPRKPLTALARNESVADTFPPEVLSRLRAIKKRVDPDGRLRSNFPVSAGAQA